MASFRNDYNIQEYLIGQLAEERFPDQDPAEVLYLNPKSKAIYRELALEVEESELFHTAFAAQFANCSIESFRMFDVDDTILAGVEATISPRKLKTEGFSYVRVEDFKRLLGIEEVQWMSFRYLSSDESSK